MGTTHRRCLPGHRVKERPTEPALDAPARTPDARSETAAAGSGGRSARDAEDDGYAIDALSLEQHGYELAEQGATAGATDDRAEQP
jgi:hypothetical protein